jgi:hypothetical protein
VQFTTQFERVLPNPWLTPMRAATPKNISCTTLIASYGNSTTPMPWLGSETPHTAVFVGATDHPNDQQ